jgi:hypothetical protein
MIASVDYAYIGPGVFILMLLAVAMLLASTRRSTHKSITLKAGIPAAACLSLLIALLMMVWGAGQTQLLTWLYAHIALLLEFRFLGRALAMAALFWIVLAGISIDMIWISAREYLGVTSPFNHYSIKRLSRAALIALLVWAYVLSYSFSAPPQRQALTLNLSGWQAFINTNSFTTFRQASESLAFLLLAALVIDVMLLALARFFSTSRKFRTGLDWRVYRTHLIRSGLLAVIVISILDLMMVNSRVLRFDKMTVDLHLVFDTIHHDDETPYPAVSLPFSPLALDAYESEIRNWMLNEGWRPGSPEGIIREGYGLSDLPPWSVEYETPAVHASTLAQAFDYRLIGAYRVGSLDDPEKTITAHLYESENALPYAFLTSADELIKEARNLEGADVKLATVLEHHQDTITIQATAPAESPYFLIVQETHFPGWRATVDGVPSQITTAQSYYSPRPQGFIAIPALLGKHTYTLQFEPPGFKIGLIIFCITLMGIGFYLHKKVPHKSVTGQK